MEKKSRPGFVEFLNIVILIALGLPALSAVTLRTQGQQGQSSQVRVKRQDEGGLDDESKALVCDFGKGPSELDICGWVHSDDVHANVRWRSGHGSLAYWLGGPMVDKSENDENGGYVYFETSYKAVNRVYSSAALESASNYERFQVINETTNYNHSQQPKLQSEPSKASFHPFKSSLSMANVELEPLLVIPNKAHLLSPNVSQTGPQGTCLNFYYNMDGLSAEKLRVLVKDMDSDINQTLWETGTETEGKWIRAAIVYAYETSHQVNCITRRKATCF
ncbi:hypothetical protein HDE_08307 [Halotydeus destructor]|nr:hypothetical protein HDE_08307 [Halotydeus destructor]